MKKERIDQDKATWGPGTLLYPLPAVLVTCGEYRGGGATEKCNVLTLSWVGTICTDPAMVSISVRPSRHSYPMIKKSGEFVINLTTKDMVFATDYCGIKSGSEMDKFKRMNLTALKADKVKAPLIKESPVNIECKVTEVKKLGTHDLFIAKVLCIHADRKYINKFGAFELNEADPICYSHGQYYALGKRLGKFGYSVKRSKSK